MVMRAAGVVGREGGMLRRGGSGGDKRVWERVGSLCVVEVTWHA